MVSTTMDNYDTQPGHALTTITASNEQAHCTVHGSLISNHQAPDTVKIKICSF